MSAQIVKATGLHKHYPGVQALDDVDFDIDAGEIVGLVGKNGAGKSTLIKVLAGVEHQDQGELVVNGARVDHGYGPVAATALGLAFVHQELAVAPDMSVAENVALGGDVPLRGGLVAWKRLRRRVAEVLADIDPGIDPRTPVGSLSPARQRVVMIARALYGDARLLVLDEPSASLTTEEVEHLHQLVRRMAADGRAVIYVSHRLGEILSLTQRVVVMHDGRVTANQPTSSLTRAQLIDAILGEDAPALSEAAPAAAAASEAGDVVLKVDGLTRAPRVRGVSLEVHAGEIVGLGGLVGAGRSEIAHCIVGLDHPDSGSIDLLGHRLTPRTPADALAAGIALVPEDRRGAGLVVDFDVRRNTTMASLSRMRRGALPFPSRRTEDRVTRETIKRLDIRTSGPGQIVGTLSGGNQQKVVFGKYLLREPRVLIVDEPTLGIDVHAKQEIFALLRRLADGGAGVLMISSDFSELVGTCDRVLGVHEGSISGELTGPHITERNITELAYGRPVVVTEEPA